MIKIIKLQDGLEVEVEVNENQAQAISNGSIVDSSMNKIQVLLSKVMEPIANTYKELDKNMNIESAKVSVGVKIGVEGNFILAKSSAGANILVEITLKATNA